MDRLTGQISRRTEELGRTAEAQLERLTAIIEQATELAATKGEPVAEQAEALIQAADRADAQAKIVREKTFDSKRYLFLRASRFVIEDLNSTAIDLNQLLDE